MRKELDRAMTEKEWMAQVREAAEWLGWLCYQTWTSIHSPAGFPDLVLLRPPRLIFAELKSERGRLTGLQERWLQLLGQCPVEVYCWKPSDWEEVIRTLGE